MSILFFACSGNIKLYNIGIDIPAISIAPIIYFLSIPATNIINKNDTIYAAAVP